jgi:hypothetical protein
MRLLDQHQVLLTNIVFHSVELDGFHEALPESPDTTVSQAGVRRGAALGHIYINLE